MDSDASFSHPPHTPRFKRLTARRAYRVSGKQKNKRRARGAGVLGLGRWGSFTVVLIWTCYPGPGCFCFSRARTLSPHKSDKRKWLEPRILSERCKCAVLLLLLFSPLSIVSYSARPYTILRS
ncbi:hypothetical protein QBC44DRAFT_328929 [Cladorrhinum sp. PSN332]|nr:hypothetical protein QBC44DRAFT_328929 [Cladorrhinum sp. PSN332]